MLIHFPGWIAHDKEAINGNMKWESYKPKTWEETDVEVKITHCGTSTTHTARLGYMC